jgi:hypothetical protein
MSLCDDTHVGVEELTAEESRDLLDEAARRLLNMSGDEFVSAWDEQRFAQSDSLEVMQVAALLPGVR